MAFTYKEVGNAKAVGTTYVLVGAGTSGRKVQAMAHVANLTASAVNLRLYIADTSWSSGEPTGGTLVDTLAYDVSIPANGVAGVGPFHIAGTNEVVVRAGTAASLDVHVFGVEES